MSKPGIIYQMQWNPVEDIQMYVDISDNDNLVADDVDQTIIQLVPNGDCFRLSVIDSSEDPFTVIKAQQCVMKFNSTSGISMSTFSFGSDQRWGVHAYQTDTSKTIFKGFISTGYISEPFMPVPNVVELTASDNLGILKGRPLVDFNGNNPTGYYPVGEILAMALQLTGLDLPIKAVFNIKQLEAHAHFFVDNYLNVKTFEDDISTCISAYDTITRLFGEMAHVFQRQGYWWVVIVDEHENETRGLYVHEFTSLGEYVSPLGEQQFNKVIAMPAGQPVFEDDIFFSMERTIVTNSQPIGTVKLTYNYEPFKEQICNQDFQRGTALSADTFRIECWQAFRANYPTSGLIAPTTSSYIKREYVNGYESARYVVIEQNSGIVSNLIMSEPVVMGYRDKFDITFTRRLATNEATGSGPYTREMGQVRLYGVDGSFYTLHGGVSTAPVPKWVATNADFTSVQQLIQYQGDASVDTTESVSKEVEAPEVPVAGYIRILLYQDPEFGDVTDTYIEPARFTYRQYINGTHDLFKGQVQQVLQTGGFLATREKEVYISDPTKPGLKGAIFYITGYNEIFAGTVTFATGNGFTITGYQLEFFRPGMRIRISGTSNNNIETTTSDVVYNIIGNTTAVTVAGSTVSETVSATIEEALFDLSPSFYNAAVYPSSPPAEAFHPYSELQVYNSWNQFNIPRSTFQAVVQGLNIDKDDGAKSNHNHLIHKWVFDYPSEHVYRKLFFLLTFDQDFNTCEWTGTFREVDNLEIPKSYTGRELKYIT